MEDRELENKISSVICGMVPEDSFDKITDRIAKGDMPERSNVKMNNGSKVKRVLFPVAAACIFLIVSVVLGLTYYGNNYAVAAVIDIDVNPSIEISINKKEKVLKVRALNDDGKEIIEGMKLDKKHVDDAVDEIVGSMVDKGYVVDDEDSGILVTVKNKDPKKADKFREKIVEDFDKALCDRDINAPVINQTATDIEEVKEFAEENDVSVGKAIFISKLIEADETLSAEELAEMSIKEIMEMLREKDIEIEKVAHCHRGDEKDNGKGEGNKDDKDNKKEPAGETLPVKPEDSVEGEVPEKPEDETEPADKPETDPEAKPETHPTPEIGDVKPSDNEKAPVISERPEMPGEELSQNNGNYGSSEKNDKKPSVQTTPSVTEPAADQAV